MRKICIIFKNLTTLFRKRIKETKIEALNVLENILDGLDAMIYVTVPQTGEILFMNDRMKRHYNITGSCIGQLCYKILQKEKNEKCDFCPCRRLDEEPGKTIEWIENNTLTNHTYRNTDCYIEWLDGTMVHLQHSVDITELNDAKEKAVQANQTKSSFLARMSHEIRSPMNVILGITEMQLEKEQLPLDIRDAFDKVYNSGYMLLNIINDILDLSKIEADKLELMPGNYEVASMINDTVQMNVMRFDSKAIQFELKADENVPMMLFGDELRIKQILNNILTNAFKYTDTGKVSLSVSAESGMSDMTLILRVSDTGRGMTNEQVEKLFDDYTRFSLEASRSIEGTGLGMSITSHLVHMMKGEISVDSAPGKGSVFTVRLPQKNVDGAGVFGNEVSESLSRLNQGNMAQIKKAPQIIREYMPYGKVLIVDDMEPNLYVARGLMSPYGLSMETAASGVEAIDKIKDGNKYDVIFMDHFMPGMDGIEAVKIIRELGYNQPIVALTANAILGQADMFLKNGFDGYISKPIDIRQLNITLNNLVRDKYPSETVEAARLLKESLNKNSSTVKLDLGHIRALVVDDFLPNLNVAAGMLRKYKIQVDCALNGQEAVNRIKNREPEYNFIFMDHLMPDMDGIEATRLIRSINTEYAQNIPVIAVTANDAIEDENMFLNNGFQVILHKPLSLAKLDGFIKDWLNNTTNDTAMKEKKIVIEIPGIDQNKIKELYDGDMEIYLPVLRSYLSAIPLALNKMRSVSEQALPDYIVCVHGVKGTSDSIGADIARKMAAELEILAKNGDISGLLAKNEALIAYVSDLLGNIQNWLAQLDS
jgi:signal transduction histidine kinase/DNA-binding response OmpR family regulator